MNRWQGVQLGPVVVRPPHGPLRLTAPRPVRVYVRTKRAGGGTHPTDPVATADATDDAIALRDACMGDYGLEIFGKSEKGRLLRGPKRFYSRARERVWPAMSTRLSFPEIAAACGMTSHSTVVEAVQRAARAAEEVA